MARKTFAWWCWLATVLALSAALAGVPGMLLAAVGLTAFQLAHALVRSKSALSFPAQVRACYLALLVIGMWPPLGFIHWIQLVGTWAVVIADYCFLARCLSLMPWNRTAPLGWRDVAHTFLTPPKAGSILQGSLAQPRV